MGLSARIEWILNFYFDVFLEEMVLISDQSWVLPI